MTEPVILIATVLVSALLPWVAEYLNQLFNLDGKKALTVAGALSAVVALAALFLTGQLTAANLTFENFTQTFTLVFGVSQVVFQLVKDQLNWSGK